jgi:hypothetical protein
VAAVQFTFTHKQYTEQHKKFGRVRAVHRLCGVYPGICLRTEEKARKNPSQGSRIVPAGTMNIHKHTIRIQYVLRKVLEGTTRDIVTFVAFSWNYSRIHDL